MHQLTISGTAYRIIAVERDGNWIAYAVRADDGERFGIECSGPTEPAACERLARWLEWQAEHAAALEALQTAEHAYHRAIAGSAFVGTTEGPSAAEIQKDALEVVEAARVRLDGIRARKPE
ncbi:MAG: hypothetical protein ACM3SQ_05315 [Betaproteobacteria bacterium]